MHFETLAIHAGRHLDPSTGAVIPPIHLSTTFWRDPLRTLAGASLPDYTYTRESNPTRVALEQALARLEGGSAAALFASGSAATLAVLQTLSSGDQVLLPQDVYYGTFKIAQGILARWGLQVERVDMTNLEQVAAALRPRTRLVWIETPSNPMLTLTDIAAIAELAHRHGARCVCDNTWATPVLQRPLDLGADWVVHSTTKYLNGHSDVLGGAVITAEAEPESTSAWGSLRQIQSHGGAVPSPFECWLTLRGLQTLPYRMRGHCQNAQTLAHFLHAHYPGLPSHPAHGLAQQQMPAFGSMVSFQVRGGRQEALQVAAQLQLFTHATSLGGPESLIEHRASIEGPNSATPENLLRVSVGLEHPQDLMADLKQALQQVYEE
ncbi:MAG: aminotransferase class I/II-fold pyridoxal phosphate-dependent enzyme [Cyanobacteriota bacterium]